MRILITNDDGINAPGLKVAQRLATEIAGPSGEVWTVAPAFEKSGVSHCINYAHPTMIAEIAPRLYAAEGAPADCVLAGVHEVMPEPPELILSGVNKGNNSAENTVYSGTIGGAMEGALQGIPAIALSQYYGPGNIGLDDTFEAAAQHGAEVIRKLLQADQWGNGDSYRTFYNVNFPPVAAAAVKGSRVVRQGLRRSGGFGVESHMPPNGRKYLWIKGHPQNTPSGPDTDATVNLEGYISVTPMRCDLTAHDLLAPLEARFG